MIHIVTETLMYSIDLVSLINVSNIWLHCALPCYIWKLCLCSLSKNKIQTCVFMVSFICTSITMIKHRAGIWQWTLDQAKIRKIDCDIRVARWNITLHHFYCCILLDDVLLFMSIFFIVQLLNISYNIAMKTLTQAVTAFLLFDALY